MLQNGIIILLGVYLVEMCLEIQVCSSWLVDKISHTNVTVCGCAVSFGYGYIFD